MSDFTEYFVILVAISVLGVELRWSAWKIGFAARCERSLEQLQQNTDQTKRALRDVQEALATLRSITGENKE